MTPFMGVIEKIIRYELKRPLNFIREQSKSMTPFMGVIEKIIRYKLKRPLNFIRAFLII